MKKLSEWVCKNKGFILIMTLILLIPSFIGMKLTKINYDILVYLPKDIETVKGQGILADDFHMGAFSVTIIDKMNAKDILSLETKIKKIDGVEKVISAYDVIGNTIPLEMLPSEITAKVKNGDSTLMLITYEDSTSAESTLKAVDSVKKLTDEHCKIGGMSAMVLDTMNLSEKEIMIYIVIAVLLCIIVLEFSLDSYVVPFLLLLNIGIAILFNLGSNIMFGEISYITKALVAVLQLGVTTDFSIFLYHSYESKRKESKTKEEAMSKAIQETFTSVMGSSLTTIAGFLVLCTMQLTLGKDLGLVMAKGVLLGVICVLTVFPSFLLYFDHWIQKTKHSVLLPKFKGLTQFILKYNKIIFIIFLILFIPAYLANKKTEVYYKLDKSLPDTLDSIVANNSLKEKFHIVSPEIILISKDVKSNEVNEMIKKIEKIDGIDFVLSFSKLGDYGISTDMLGEEVQHIFYSDQYQMILINSTYDIATKELNEQVKIVNDIMKKYDEHAILAGEGPLMKDLIETSDTDFQTVNTSSIVCILIIMLFVLKSISLPILLILAIEFAIFINMGIPYFTDVTLPFVAPIVLGTIQLGATIDYAILLTTTYLKNRKELEKQKAMEETLHTCISSIVVSGLCFFGATFGVGVYSKLEMISSLCTLISRGALISMAVVIFVLPSILLLFDSIIRKTTVSVRKEKKTMKRKVMATILLIGIFASSTPVSALTKEETVYCKLTPEGNIKSVLVNEHLMNEEKLDRIEDYSELKDILNVNGNESFTMEENRLTWDSKGNDIFYQGTTEKESPVSLHITYMLNGEEISLKDLIGKSGKVSIQLTYENKEKHGAYINGRYETLYTPFVVAAGTMFPSETVSNMEVENGKVVNTGNKMMVVGIAAPGLYESLNVDKFRGMDQITITFDTTKFELPSIYSVVTSKLIGEEDLEIFDELDSLYGSMSTLKDSINKIEEGAKTLNSGAFELTEGTQKIAENLALVAEKMKQIEEGTVSIDDNLNMIIDKLEEAEMLLNQDTSSEYIQIQELLKKDEEAVDSLKDSTSKVKSAYDMFDLQNLDVKTILSFTPEIYASFGMEGLTEEEAEMKNMELVTVKVIYENSYENSQGMIQLLGGNKDAIEGLLTTLSDLKTQVTTLLTTLKGGLTELEAGSNTLATGTTALREGVDVLSAKTEELAQGVKTLSEGTTTLSDGIVTFNSQGITKLNSFINYDVRNFELRMKELSRLGEEYNSFGEKQEGTKGSTKFIFVVDGVQEEKKAEQKEVQKEKEDFWSKLVHLFN